MSGLFAAVLIILVIFTLLGYFKGFVRTIFSLISYILLIGLVSWFSPHVTEFLEKNTPIHSMIQEKCAEGIRKETAKGIDQKLDEQEPIKIGGFQLPAEIQKQIFEKTEDTTAQVLENSGIYTIIADYIAGFILNGIAFIVTFILVSVILRFIVNMLDIITKLPVLKGVNRILGAVTGLVEGLGLVWLIFFIITIISTSELGRYLVKQINENQFLQFLYDYNPIVALIRHFFQF